jgi:hypothetical protein
VLDGGLSEHRHQSTTQVMPATSRDLAATQWSLRLPSRLSTLPSDTS